MKISCVTGFPFNPPADKQEDTIHVAGEFYSACVRHDKAGD
jgi:hypothetical protein